MSSRRWLLRGLAIGLSVVAIAWVVWIVLRDFGEVRSQVASGELVHSALLGSVAYTALTILLAVAWWWLAGLEGNRPPLVAAYAAWARSQIAKYLPGNVFHYATRQVLGRGLGLSHRALASSAVFEIVSTVLAALVLSSIAFAGGRLPPWVPMGLTVLLVATIALLLLRRFAEPLARRWPLLGPAVAPLSELTPSRLVSLVGPAFVLHGAFFVGTGFVLYGLLVRGWPLQQIDPQTVILSYAAAWLLGTVAPGAPGGLGVREAALAIALGPSLGAANASALALVLRLVTTLGDVLTALLGWAVPLEPASHRRRTVKSSRDMAT